MIPKAEVSETPSTYVKPGLIGLYCLAWSGLLFISGARWWDDWALFDMDPGERTGYFLEIGRPWWGGIHNFLIQSFPYSYPFLTFGLFLFVNLSFLSIIQQSNLFKKTEVFWISAIFATLPIVGTRSLAIFMPFVLGLALFFLAWRVLLKWNNLNGKITASLLFTLSFTTSSLLVFFAIPVVFFFIRTSQSAELTPKKIQLFIAANWIWLISPLLFWAPSRIFFSPKGIAEDYNSALNFDSPKILITFVMLILVTALFAFMFFRSVKNNLYSTSDWLSIFWAGGAVLGLALIPYVAVNKIPIFLVGFDDRFLLLAPAGLSLLILSFLRFTANRSFKIAKVTFVSSISLFICLANLQIMSLALDNQKQLEIVNFLSTNSDLGSNSTFIFEDDCRRFNIGNRDFTHYELSGMLSAAYGGDSRIGFENSKLRVNEFRNILLDPQKQYFMGAIRNYSPDNVGVFIQINCSPGFLNFPSSNGLDLRFSSSAITDVEAFLSNNLSK